MSEKTKLDNSVVGRIRRVAIAGAGGIGGYLTQFLYDFGVNRNQFPFSQWKWTVFDNDTVDSSNLLHQNFTEDDLGMSKAQVIAGRTANMITAEERFMTVEDFANFDVVFSCVDSMDFRKALYEYGWANPGKLYWVDGRCSSRNIGLYHSGVSRKTAETGLSDSTERRGCLLAVDKEAKVSHFTPVTIASMMAQCFLNHLRGEDTSDRILLVI